MDPQLLSQESMLQSSMIPPNLRNEIDVEVTVPKNFEEQVVRACYSSEQQTPRSIDTGFVFQYIISEQIKALLCTAGAGLRFTSLKYNNLSMFTQHEIASNSRIIGMMSGLKKLDLTLSTYDIGINPQPGNDWADIFRSLTSLKNLRLANNDLDSRLGIESSEVTICIEDLFIRDQPSQIPGPGLHQDKMITMPQLESLTWIGWHTSILNRPHDLITVIDNHSSTLKELSLEAMFMESDQGIEIGCCGGWTKMAKHCLRNMPKDKRVSFTDLSTEATLNGGCCKWGLQKGDYLWLDQVLKPA